MSQLVSVIICSRDRHEDLVRAVESVRRCGKMGATAEIVVVEETDEPRPISGVRYVPIPRRAYGFGYARNVAVKESSGDLLLFLDDDCEAEAGWADHLVAPFLENGAILGVAGAVLVRHCGLIGYAENVLGFPGGGLRYWHEAGGRVVPTRHLSTCNCAYRRHAVLEAGGFSEEARTGGEDFLLAERVSARGPCVYTPEAVVYHMPRGTFAAVFRWFVRRGYSEICLWPLVVHRARFTGFLLRSSWTLRALIVGAVAVRWPSILAWMPVAALAYGGALLWRFRFARRYPNHRRAWWLVPLVKVTMDLGTEVGRWKALVRPERI